MNRDTFRPEHGNRRLLRAVLVAAFIACAAPLIGGAIFLVLFAYSWLEATIAGQPWDVIRFLSASFISFMLLVVYNSYVLGGLQALLAGAWIGARVYRSGTFGAGEAQLTAVAANVIWAVIFMILASPDWGSIGLGVIGLAPISMVSALVCRALLSALGLIARSTPPRAASL